MFPANRLPLLLISTKVEPKTKASELPLRDALPNLVRDNPFLGDIILDVPGSGG